ncbi:MAG TPA: hypothetical protein VN025_19000 [Candidatus Dormibacteraeota bacterium]|jgi:hypothetical protein|nr:hypothetical protein [Candidatus Dormibacteraeota bacterium]
MNRKFLAIQTGSLFALATIAQLQVGAQVRAQAEANASAGTTASAQQGSANGSASSSASTQAQSNGSSASIADGTAINASLSAPVDSKKAKEGDAVTAHTTDAVKAQGKTVLPKGTKLIGHVTRASARSKGDAESALGIAFDRAVLKDGQEVALNGSIRALASAESAANVGGSDLEAIGSAGAYGGGGASGGNRGMVGGVASTAGAATGTVANTAGNVGNTAGGAVDATARTTTRAAGAANGAAGGLNAAGQLTSNSRGVFGLNGLNLNAAGSNSTEGSVITSAGKNVHLDSGTRLLFVSGAQASTSNAPASPAPKP